MSKKKILCLLNYNKEKMTKINVITPPDKLYNDAVSLLAVFPSKDLQLQLQMEFLSKTSHSVNLYYYDHEAYADDSFQWLLDVFVLSTATIIDIDNIPHSSYYIRDILSYMIAKPKTYWLTTQSRVVYNHISNNRIYDLKFLSEIGVTNE